MSSLGPNLSLDPRLWRELTPQELQQFLDFYPVSFEQYVTPLSRAQQLFELLQREYPEPVVNLIIASKLDQNSPKYPSELILNLDEAGRAKFAHTFGLPVNKISNQRIWKILKIAHLLYPPQNILSSIFEIEQFCANLDFESAVRLRESIGNWDLDCRIPLPEKYAPISYLPGVNPMTIETYHWLKKFGSVSGAFVSFCGNGDLDIVQLFLSPNFGVSPNTEYNGNTCLGSAAQFGQLAIVKLLVEKGADINKLDDLHQSALLLAARDGHLEVVKYLVGQGADLESWNEEERTVIMVAVEYNRIDVVKYLIEAGADLEAQDENGETVLDIARYNESEELIALLENLEE